MYFRDSSTILKEVNNLIRSSCKIDNIFEQRYNRIHRAIIKKHFNASEVSIDQGRQEIVMKIRTKQGDATVNFDCPDLGAFLRSCIENDRNSLAFYKNMLGYYNQGVRMN